MGYEHFPSLSISLNLTEEAKNVNKNKIWHYCMQKNYELQNADQESVHLFCDISKLVLKFF